MPPPAPRRRCGAGRRVIRMVHMIALLLVTAVLIRAEACPDPVQTVARRYIHEFNSDGTRLVVWKSLSEGMQSPDSLLVYGIDAQGGLNFLSGVHVLGHLSAMFVSPDVVVFKGSSDLGIGYPVFRFIGNDRLQLVCNVPSESEATPSIAKVRDLICTANLNSITFSRLTDEGVPIPIGTVSHVMPFFSGQQRENQLIAVSSDTIFVYDILPGQFPVLSHLFSPGIPITEVIPDPNNLFLVTPSSGVLRCRTQADSLVVQAEAAWPTAEQPNLHFIGATDSLLFFTSVRGTVALDATDRDHMRWCGPFPWDRSCVDRLHNTIISLDDRLGIDSLVVSSLECRPPDLDLRGDIEDDALPLALIPSMVLSGSTCPFREDFMDCEACECITHSQTDPHGDSIITREWHTGGKDVFYQFTVAAPGTLTMQLSANYAADLALRGPAGTLACGPGPFSRHLDPGTYSLIVDGTFGDVRFITHNGDWGYVTLDSSGSYAVMLNWSPDVAVDPADAPSDVVLGEAAPNPFNPSTSLELSLPSPQHIRAEVRNAAGQLVRTLLDGELLAGSHTLTWDGLTAVGAPAASGLYLATIVGRNHAQTRKLLLLR